MDAKPEQKYTAHLPNGDAIPGLSLDQALQVIAKFETSPNQDDSFTREFLQTVGHFIVRFMWVDSSPPMAGERVLSLDQATASELRSPPPIGLSASPPPKPQGPQPGDDRLLRAIVANVGNFNPVRQQRWAHLSALAGIVSAEAITLCHRFDIDPEALVGGGGRNA